MLLLNSLFFEQSSIEVERNSSKKFLEVSKNFQQTATLRMRAPVITSKMFLSKIIKLKILFPLSMVIIQIALDSAGVILGLEFGLDRPNSSGGFAESVESQPESLR